MALKLYYHPLSSFCWKVLIALYENNTPFEPHLVDLSDQKSREAFLAIWPIGKFPVLKDDAGNRVIPESTIIIEYLARRYPGPTQLVPADPDLALRARAFDRFFDLNIHYPMQKIVGDKLRPDGAKEAFGVDQARTQMKTAFDVHERQLSKNSWAVGDAFTMADCSAAPALHYASLVQPFADSHPNLAGYFKALQQRPSFARVLEEAAPYRHLFPG
jgi:glutathione S-transferase